MNKWISNPASRASAKPIHWICIHYRSTALKTRHTASLDEAVLFCVGALFQLALKVERAQEVSHKRAGLKSGVSSAQSEGGCKRKNVDFAPTDKRRVSFPFCRGSERSNLNLWERTSFRLTPHAQFSRHVKWALHKYICSLSVSLRNEDPASTPRNFYKQSCKVKQPCMKSDFP